MSVNQGSIRFNSQVGALEWEGQVCPYLDINSSLGMEISILETAKEEFKQCLDLLELSLTSDKSNKLLQESLATLFVQKYRANMNKQMTNNIPLSHILLNESQKYMLVHQHLEEHAVHMDSAVAKSMSLRLALKPMQENEALLSFYCFKKGKPVFSAKGIARIRKLIKYTLRQIGLLTESKYRELRNEYQSVDIHGLYNLAYQKKM